MKAKPFLLSSLALSLALATGSASAGENADTVYVNGQVYTVNTDQAWAEAFAVKDGKFVKLGSSKEIMAFKDADSKVVDLKGQFVMPGFIDAHTHPVRVKMVENVFFNNSTANLEHKTPEEFGKLLQEYAKGRGADKEWIFGKAFSWSYFHNTGVTMDRHYLDKYIPDRPAAIEDEGGHVVVVNTRALELAGITKDTKAAEGGKILLDEKGEPNGHLVAGPAIQQVLKYHPAHRMKDVTEAAVESMKEINAFGITSVKVMEGDREQMQAYHDLDKAGKLTMDVNMHPYINEFYFGKSILPALKEKHKYETERFRVDGVKTFIDSSPFGRAAALHKPYAGSDDYGKLYTPYERFKDEMIMYNGMGLAVTTHTVGDRGMSLVLKAMEESAKVNGIEKVRELRNHIAHCFMVEDQDFARAKNVNATMEFSPGFWTPMPVYEMLAQDMPNGMEDIKNFFPIKKAIAEGNNYVAASDWSQSPLDPLQHIETLTTRRMPGASESEKSMNPDAVIPLENAIRSYTLNAAVSLRLEDKVGSLEKGKKANFQIMSNNLFEVPKNQVHAQYPTKVYYEGKLIAENDRKPVEAS
ncbi:amidohydrolase [Endozoicomonas euniceicola]|uniref:Amidohydrolase n=1 Tax=Endozoicomonas euniceicola TaxID=1234143 RepID=A0ABY6H0U6_9GAMM|nr:amidohydrolase [Endozoicomonas euniceicola]UYM18663.1 amidohydrolase [Endozoicomonas euniceicola]